MSRIRVDMFGLSAGRGSVLDVLVPDADQSWDAAAVSSHVRDTDAHETALVVSCADGAFTTRIFHADGESPFGTHSMAGVAACLVARGRLTPGSDLVEHITPNGAQRLWTDGHHVRVPFHGPAVHHAVPIDPDLVSPYTGRAFGAGVGRRFTLVHVDEDPRSLPAPDPVLMRKSGLSDLTLFQWDPERRHMAARVFAPGFGFPEDAGCLPAASALGVAALSLDPTSQGVPVTVNQSTARGTESVFTCVGTIVDGTADIKVSGRVWVMR
ncbi:PhzF family phenazine biosynthesis protein [Nocardiopsis sp. L17-MgMaSL7]|uniref:PhzF family phenazine biosynthesis protein n=1 Tax=Nocardiopsis sp. L17-MgMaSL7 TaxID=1938893 RepID=UPI000D70C365|nr:PhzF family phenazine biosynthesis protein [Nocardiopsis sp. L17-MgMaSL7]PWV57376.1 putative PhzF superfamily epimerase YddE/YHI9 [Nocardiopsis sp. L17-MgMaSL7]